MKIAVEGCAHGELEKIYNCIETIQERENFKIDLLICCGDFQSVRNSTDLRAMAVPVNYQRMCSFYKYYSGERQAPVLTIFIGGNHEASNFLQELPYGGWVAPNIFYLGRSGVVKFGNLRIGGISGIFKAHDYFQGLWECPPYTQSSLRSVYHVRSLDVFRLNQLKEKVHVMLSHDWPKQITNYGDKEKLLRRKKFLRQDIESNQLGSMPAEQLLHSLKPEYWFAAHLHCRFPALVKHEETNSETKFLALDKCLPDRRHLQILDLPSEYDGDKCLKYDAEWLAILKNTNHLLVVKNINYHLPGPGGNERYDFTPTEEEKKAVINIMKDMNVKPDSFVKTAPIYNPNDYKTFPSVPLVNPQTVYLCETLGIDDPVQVVMARTGREMMKLDIETKELKMEKENEMMYSSTVDTPQKSFKLCLPAPVTPSDIADTPRENVLSPKEVPSPDIVKESDISSNVSVDSNTPSSFMKKKTFKRRNLSIYTTTDTDDSISNASTSLVGLDSPHATKLPCRDEL